ncbi:MAG: Tad domain-containing protein, partial [Candidatus Sumerlaeia bacterium]|nr:Tad domain-containing protein [Candidatus Sumerlaeia bacterium]
MLLEDIRNLSSLNNLKKSNLSSQVATLLILIIAAMLIFVLIVANVGQVSNYATNLSNAADSASLFLASQIATKAYQLSMSLMQSCGRPHRCCQKTGLLSTLLSIIVAIIAIILSYFTFGASLTFLAYLSTMTPYV